MSDLPPGPNNPLLDRSSQAYRKAFENYLRYGTPIQLPESKAEDHPTTHYIWRTRKDGKVRASHAANDGKIFAWDDPPKTGHPGEGFGCRCWAEPHYQNVYEHMTMVMSGISDAGKRWKDGLFGDFVDHYRNGNGRGIRLRDTGHLQNVVDEYWRRVETRLLGQIADAARKEAGSSFSYDFKNTYKVRNIVFSLGETTIGGVATGTSRFRKTGALQVSGHCEFYLEDAFKDVGDILNIIPGNNFDDPRATTYRIYDAWQGTFSGVVEVTRELSKYRFDGE